jgi:hypothetical protein
MAIETGRVSRRFDPVFWCQLESTSWSKNLPFIETSEVAGVQSARRRTTTSSPQAGRRRTAGQRFEDIG